MKSLLKKITLVISSVTLFSFTTEKPKTVIIDIVDNIESTNGKNLTEDFNKTVDQLNIAEDLNILDWKKISNGLDDSKKQQLLDSIQPEVVLTINFKNSKTDENSITAVVSKQSQHLENSTLIARELTNAFETNNVKNSGVFQTDSNYIQDNLKPALYVSIETKNDSDSNDKIIHTLSNFIKSVKANPTAHLTEAVEIEND